MNEALAKIFYEIADLLELQGVEWKPQAYRNAARSVIEADDVASIYTEKGAEGLEEIPGIGEGIAKKIVEFIENGNIEELDKIKRSLPRGLGDLLNVISIGSKRLMRLNKELGIKSVRDLERAAKAHRIAALSGFGAKSEKDILESIELFRKSPGRIPYAEALKFGNTIKRKLRPYCERVELAGSLRYKRDTIGDLDILAIAKDSSKVMDAFRKCGVKVLSSGPTKTIIILKNGTQADLRVVEPKSFGAALLYFTGPVGFNVWLRKIAISKGYKLSEYGLFNRQSGKLVASKTEEEIFRKLGVNYLKPEDRKKIS